jgi:hypothetical protein
MNTQVPEFPSSNMFVAEKGWLAAGIVALLAGCGQQTLPAAASEPPGVSVVTVRALAAAAGSLTGALIRNSRPILLALGDRVWRRRGN